MNRRLLFIVVCAALVALVCMNLLTPEPTPELTREPKPIPPRTPSNTVHAIYAIPSDKVYDARFEQAISDAVRGVQLWYGEQLGGVSFEIVESLPLICELDEPSQKFQGMGGFAAVTEAVQHCAPVDWFSEWTWVIHIDVPIPPCENKDAFELGAGAGGIAILHGADLRGLVRPAPYQPCDWWPEQTAGRWHGGLAHELGHAFGLHHPNGCHRETCADRSVMWAGMYAYPDTFFNNSDKALLKARFQHNN